MASFSFARAARRGARERSQITVSALKPSETPGLLALAVTAASLREAGGFAAPLAVLLVLLALEEDLRGSRVRPLHLQNITSFPLRIPLDLTHPVTAGPGSVHLIQSPCGI